ncbi:Rieske (2Fe-2S) protein [Algoriphagus chordae]|uniref:Nitrite reductase (NADH) small subunit n=1 Tax=Algoriphagus chordae TaxID=237019 RepID=A0A2W7RAL3_9BACT|nr:Rieske 2Fe-2S domain-containing protein [Algoriphagus chordae]PZX52707.1 nitrite reductase (NADH) small subunit [Algoriphagus chordae]
MNTFTLGISRKQVLEMIPEQAIHKIHVGELVVALVRIAEDFHAFQADCPHRGTSLFQGSIINQNEIICPLHEYRFDFKTGQVKAGSCGNLEVYPTELTEEGLKIFLSPE